MSFDYEQSVWGNGQASLSWIDPTRPRLKYALKALSALRSGDKVLEVGCGAGQFIRSIKKTKPELDCHGCDISQTALEQAKNFAGGVVYSLSQPSRLPYEDNSLQAVLIFDVLEHIDDVKGMLSEVNRVLQPNGIFHCFVPCEGDWLSMWNALEKLHICSGLTKKYAGHVQKFSRHDLKRLISGTGEIPTKSGRAEEFIYPVVFATRKIHTPSPPCQHPVIYAGEQGFIKEYKFVIIKTRYSSHFLGQLLDIAVFTAMHRLAKRKPGEQLNNEKFFSELNKKQGGWFRKFKSVVNFLVNMEGFLKSWWPSANIHITAIKK